MQLRPGYKKTEIGVIPEDWDVQPLGRCLLKRPSYGINAPAVPYSDRLPVYIRITDITEDGRFLPSPRVSVRSEMSGRYFLEPGDIVFARTGASVGKSYRYRPEDGQLVYAGFLIRIRPNPDRLLTDFASAYVTTGRYWQWVSLMSMRSGQPGINGNEYAQLLVPIPPPTEQKAIAEALSDVDASIAALLRLIAKKRDLRQGAMQRLLTGQTRLPGFKEQWTTKLIGEFTDCTAGGTPSTKIAGYWGGEIRWMSSGELHQGEVWDVVGRITKQGLEESAAKLVPPNCVLVGLAGQGKTRGTVAINMVELSTNQSIAAIFPNSMFSSKFLFYILQDRYEELRELSSGDGGRGGLNLKLIRSIRVPFPTVVDEQTAIARVLSDMDTELSVLNARLEKTRALKQAMMQALLTGRVRLPVRRDAAPQTKEAAYA